MDINIRWKPGIESKRSSSVQRSNVKYAYNLTFICRQTINSKQMDRSPAVSDSLYYHKHTLYYSLIMDNTKRVYISHRKILRYTSYIVCKFSRVRRNVTLDLSLRVATKFRNDKLSFLYIIIDDVNLRKYERVYVL